MFETKPTYSFNIHSNNEVTIFEICIFMSCFTQKWLNINFWLMRLMLLVSSIYVFMLYLQMNLFFGKKIGTKEIENFSEHLLMLM